MHNKNLRNEKHINFLKKIGFLISYNTLKLYHGRSKTSAENWFVKTDIDNSFNANSNNIMAIPCLCVASYSVAESYAKGASLDGRTGDMQIHEIVSTDDNSLIVNEKFNINKLTEGEVIKFYQAIQSLASGALKEYIKTIGEGKLVWNDFNFKLISQKDEGEIYKGLSLLEACLDKELFDKIVGAINADLYFKKLPMFTISNYVFAKQEKRDYISSGGEKYRFNQDYIRNIMDKNNIIGIDKKAYSGTNDHIVYIFNLSKVQTIDKLCQEEKQ